MMMYVNYFSGRLGKKAHGLTNNGKFKIKRSISLFHLHFIKQKKISKKEMIICIYRVFRHGFYMMNPSRFLCDWLATLQISTIYGA